MSILKLKPACKDYIWGGTRLIAGYNKEYDGNCLAETWELSCHPDGPSRVTNGEYAGKTLRAYIEATGKEILGKSCQKFDDFPILIKLIDASDNLSVQVHPDNRYALAHENQYGKTEVWYVLEAGKDAFLYYGFAKPISGEEFRERIGNGTLTHVLNAVPVKKGDVFFIPPGTLHAICRDIVVAEVQQNSNVTYRVFDYGRLGADGKPRALHVDKAVEVTKCVPPEMNFDFGNHLAKCEYFTVDRVEAPFEGCCDDQSFTSLLALSGEGWVKSEDETMPVRKGDSLFLPAGSGTFRLEGSVRCLLTRVGT